MTVMTQRTSPQMSVDEFEQIAKFAERMWDRPTVTGPTLMACSWPLRSRRTTPIPTTATV